MGFFPVNPPASSGGGGATIIGTPGPPTSGAHTAGYTVLDSNGATWMCTASGTPGTFVTISGKPNPDWPPPSGSLGFDYEFNATTASIPSGWSWLNQGTTTYSEGSGSGVLNLPASSDNVRGLTQPIPTAPFTITSKIILDTPLFTAAYFNAGLLLTDGTKCILLGIGSNVGNSINVASYTTPSVFNATVAGWYAMEINPMYLRIVYTSATNASFLVSSDGVGWSTVVGAVNLQGTYGLTPTAIGWYGDTPTVAIAASCQFFRVR